LRIRRHWSIAALFEAGWAPAAVFIIHLALSRVLRLYVAYPTVDIGMHLLGGLAIAFFFWRASVLASEAGVIGGINRTGIGVVVFGLTCAAAVFWELAAAHVSLRCASWVAGCRARLVRPCLDVRRIVMSSERVAT